MTGKKGTKLYKWQNQPADICAKCGRGTNVTVDHIVPVSILKFFDNADELIYNDERNYQYLCRPCNVMKAGNLDITNPRTAKLLIEYLTPYKN